MYFYNSNISIMLTYPNKATAMKTNRNKTLAITIAAIITITGATAQTVKKRENDNRTCCHIEGRSIGDPACRNMLLYVYNTDLRIGRCDTIPVGADGRFTYNLITTGNNVYEMIAENDYNNGGGYTTKFFAENGTVSIKRYADSTDRRPELTAYGPLNREMLRLEKLKMDMFLNGPEQERRILEEKGKGLISESQKLKDMMTVAKTDGERNGMKRQADSLDMAVKSIVTELDAVNERYSLAMADSRKYLLDYARSKATPVGLFYLHQVALMAKHMGGNTADSTEAIYDSLYAEKFPDNIISRYMRNWIAGRNIKTGGHFIDFTAPDLDGRNHTLSVEIAGRIALIDLWASWCGPCRRNSKSMIPVYEEFRDRGFTVVGVARERNAEHMRKAIARDGYTWLNLLELDDKALIWERYGCPNGGGMTVLVDRDGNILAVNPKADEVRDILGKKL